MFLDILDLFSSHPVVPVVVATFAIFSIALYFGSPNAGTGFLFGLFVLAPIVTLPVTWVIIVVMANYENGYILLWVPTALYVAIVILITRRGARNGRERIRKQLERYDVAGGGRRLRRSRGRGRSNPRRA